MRFCQSIIKIFGYICLLAVAAQHYKMLFRKIAKALQYNLSIKESIRKRVIEFLSVDTGGVLRNATIDKERKYKNIQISEDFKKLDEKRKLERLENIKRRQI